MTRPELWTCKLVREPSPLPASTNTRVSGPAEIARIFHTLHGDEPREVFVAFYLTTQHRIIGYTVVTTGIVDAAMVHPREVFRAAILANASAVILVHNHPSGDPTPSPEDRNVTRQLREAGRVVGIRLLDHVVVGGLKDNGTPTWATAEPGPA